MMAPTAAGTFRDKKGNFWINIEALCDYLGANFQIERRKIKALGFFHPHTFLRYRQSSGGSRTRYRLFCLPASELSRWISVLADVPSYTDPRSGRKMVIDRKRIADIRRSLKRLKNVVRIHLIEQAISA